MIKVKQVNAFDELKLILNDYFQENKLSKEKKIERIQAFEVHFNREDSAYFLATFKDVPKGFMSLDITETIIQTNNLFIKKFEKSDEIIYELISSVTKQLKSLKKEYLQIFFVHNLKIKQQLMENNFAVYTRVKMVYDLKENKIPEFTLDPDYVLSYFTLEKLDEELQIIVDTNKNNIDGEIFPQFSNLDILRKFFFRSNKDIDRLRTDSPVILKDDKIVGVNIVVNFSDTNSYIWSIALLPGHRRKGLGKYLMLKAHEICKKAGVDQMILDVTVDNVAAYNLYKNLGYKETMRYLSVLKKY